jgi:hypothetical protein
MVITMRTHTTTTILTPLAMIPATTVVEVMRMAMTIKFIQGKRWFSTMAITILFT